QYTARPRVSWTLSGQRDLDHRGGRRLPEAHAADYLQVGPGETHSGREAGKRVAVSEEHPRPLVGRADSEQRIGFRVLEARGVGWPGRATGRFCWCRVFVLLLAASCRAAAPFAWSSASVSIPRERRTARSSHSSKLISPIAPIRSHPLLVGGRAEAMAGLRFRERIRLPGVFPFHGGPPRSGSRSRQHVP